VKVSVQLIVHPDDDAAAAPMVREVFSLDRDGLTPDTLGLQLAEAQDLLVAVQDTVITHQVRDCGPSLNLRLKTSSTVQTGIDALVGTVTPWSAM